MRTSSVHTPSVQTNVARLRTVLNQVMAAAETPALSGRIRKKREALQQAWEANNPGKNGNPFTQEKVAGRVGITLGAYRKLETEREPKPSRLRQIALALKLDEDFFLPSQDLTSATGRLEAETERLRGLGDDLESLLGDLRSRVQAVKPD